MESRPFFVSPRTDSVQPSPPPTAVPSTPTTLRIAVGVLSGAFLFATIPLWLVVSAVVLLFAIHLAVAAAVSETALAAVRSVSAVSIVMMSLPIVFFTFAVSYAVTSLAPDIQFAFVLLYAHSDRGVVTSALWAFLAALSAQIAAVNCGAFALSRLTASGRSAVDIAVAASVGAGLFNVFVFAHRTGVDELSGNKPIGELTALMVLLAISAAYMSYTALAYKRRHDDGDGDGDDDGIVSALTTNMARFVFSLSYFIPACGSLLPCIRVHPPIVYVMAVAMLIIMVTVYIAVCIAVVILLLRKEHGALTNQLNIKCGR